MTEASVDAKQNVPPSWELAHEECCVDMRTLCASPGDVLRRIPDGTELSWRVPVKSDVITVSQSDAAADGITTDSSGTNRLPAVRPSSSLTLAASAVAQRIDELEERKKRSMDTSGKASLANTIRSSLFSVVGSLLSPKRTSAVVNDDGSDYSYDSPPPKWKQDGDDAFQDDNSDDDDLRWDVSENSVVPTDVGVVNFDLAYDCVRHLRKHIDDIECDDIDIPVKIMQRFPSEGSLSWHTWCQNCKPDAAVAPSVPSSNRRHLDLLRDLQPFDLELLLHIFVQLGYAKIVRRSPVKKDLVVLSKTGSLDEDDALNKNADMAVAIFDLENAITTSESQIERWSAAIDDCMRRAAHHKREGKTQQALFQLKRKNLYSSRIDSMESTVLNLQNALGAVRGAASTQAAASALASTSQALKMIREAQGRSTADVDDVCLDLKEEIDHVEDVGSILKESVQQPSIDEDDLIAELDNLSLHDDTDGNNAADENTMAPTSHNDSTGGHTDKSSTENADDAVADCNETVGETELSPVLAS